METIYTIVHFYQDYEYPDDTHSSVECSFRTLEDAEKALKEIVNEHYENGDNFDSDEEYQLFLKLNFRSPECFIDEREDRYNGFNIVENELK